MHPTVVDNFHVASSDCSPAAALRGISQLNVHLQAMHTVQNEYVLSLIHFIGRGFFTKFEWVGEDGGDTNRREGGKTFQNGMNPSPPPPLGSVPVVTGEESSKETGNSRRIVGRSLSPRSVDLSLFAMES